MRKLIVKTRESNAYTAGVKSVCLRIFAGLFALRRGIK